MMFFFFCSSINNKGADSAETIILFARRCYVPCACAYACGGIVTKFNDVTNDRIRHHAADDPARAQTQLGSRRLEVAVRKKALMQVERSRVTKADNSTNYH